MTSNSRAIYMTPSLSSDAPLDDAYYESAIQSVRKRIVDFAAPKVGKEAAEDIAQECLLFLMQRYPQVRDLSSILKIAITHARYKIFEHFRRTKRYVALAETADETDNHRATERRQIMERVLPAMLALGEKCRRLLRLKIYEEKGSAEIQKLLGLNSINTVYTWESRCFKQLMANLKGTLYVAR